jgi:hypothetical protein
MVQSAAQLALKEAPSANAPSTATARAQLGRRRAGRCRNGRGRLAHEIGSRCFIMLVGDVVGLREARSPLLKLPVVAKLSLRGIEGR